MSRRYGLALAHPGSPAWGPRLASFASALAFVALFSFVALCACTLASTADAKIYKYVDDDGHTHYSDSFSSVPPRYHDQIRDITDDLDGMEGFRVVAGANEDAAPAVPADDADAGFDFDLSGGSKGGMAGGEVVEQLFSSLGFGLILIVLLALPILWMISAGILILACKFAGEEPPSLGRACGILLAQGLAGGAVGAATGGVAFALGVDTSASVASDLAVTGASSALGWLVGAAILSSMASIGYAKSLWIGILHSILGIVLIGGPIAGIFAVVYLAS